MREQLSLAQLNNKDAMKSFIILLSLCCFWMANVVSANNVVSPLRVEIALTGDFDIPHGSGNGHRSISPEIPFSAFFNDNYSIDLDFYQPISEVEIVISQNGIVVYSFTENVESPVLRNVPLRQDLLGDFLLEIKGSDGAYAFGWFTIY